MFLREAKNFLLPLIFITQNDLTKKKHEDVLLKKYKLMHFFLIPFLTGFGFNQIRVCCFLLIIIRLDFLVLLIWENRYSFHLDIFLGTQIDQKLGDPRELLMECTSLLLLGMFIIFFCR